MSETAVLPGRRESRVDHAGFAGGIELADGVGDEEDAAGFGVHGGGDFAIAGGFDFRAGVGVEVRIDEGRQVPRAGEAEEVFLRFDAA